VLRKDGWHVVDDDDRLTRCEEDPEFKRQRKELLSDEAWERSARESDRRIAVEDAIAGRRRTVFAPAARRTPAARPAARRPRTSGSRGSSRAGPDGESDDPEPGEARPVAGPSPRFSRVDADANNPPVRAAP